MKMSNKELKGTDAAGERTAHPQQGAPASNPGVDRRKFLCEMLSGGAVLAVAGTTNPTAAKV